MDCPHCRSSNTTRLKRTTSLGYAIFKCHACQVMFNERTGAPFNEVQCPTDIAMLVVLWRVRYKLSLRDNAEMFLSRGYTFTDEAVRCWEARFAPLLMTALKVKRRGQAGNFWCVDENYVKIQG